MVKNEIAALVGPHCARKLKDLSRIIDLRKLNFLARVLWPQLERQLSDSQMSATLSLSVFQFAISVLFTDIENHFRSQQNQFCYFLFFFLFEGQRIHVSSSWGRRRRLKRVPLDSVQNMVQYSSPDTLLLTYIHVPLLHIATARDKKTTKKREDFELFMYRLHSDWVQNKVYSQIWDRTVHCWWCSQCGAWWDFYFSQARTEEGKTIDEKISSCVRNRILNFPRLLGSKASRERASMKLVFLSRGIVPEWCPGGQVGWCLLIIIRYHNRWMNIHSLNMTTYKSVSHVRFRSINELEHFFVIHVSVEIIKCGNPRKASNKFCKTFDCMVGWLAAQFFFLFQNKLSKSGKK